MYGRDADYLYQDDDIGTREIQMDFRITQEVKKAGLVNLLNVEGERGEEIENHFPGVYLFN